MWVVFAFGSALFAGVTAILAKLGLRDMDSSLATALRTVVVLAFSWLMVYLAGLQEGLRHLDARDSVPCAVRFGDGRFLAVLLPRAANRGYQQGHARR